MNSKLQKLMKIHEKVNNPNTDQAFINLMGMLNIKVNAQTKMSETLNQLMEVKS